MTLAMHVSQIYLSVYRYFARILAKPSGHNPFTQNPPGQNPLGHNLQGQNPPKTIPIPNPNPIPIPNPNPNPYPILTPTTNPNPNLIRKGFDQENFGQGGFWPGRVST